MQEDAPQRALHDCVPQAHLPWAFSYAWQSPQWGLSVTSGLASGAGTAWQSPQ